MAPGRVEVAPEASSNKHTTHTPNLTSAQATRLLARRNKITSTAGFAPGYLQANLIVLPGEYASHFADLCARNPVPCPLLGVTPPGDPHHIIPAECLQTTGDSGTQISWEGISDEELVKIAMTPMGFTNGSIISSDPTSVSSTFSSAKDQEPPASASSAPAPSASPVAFDIRTDIPSYKTFHSGTHVSTQRDILSEWGPTHVGFLIGCSYSFEDALVAAGSPLRHQEQGTIVPMYKTNIPVLPAGIFSGAKYIVSMRPFPAADIERVRDVTRPYLATHGEPVAWGWDGAEAIGIKNVECPDFGQKAEIREGEVPVFWGCGVTPQMVVEAAGDRIQGVVMSHDPGHMLITDLTVEDLARLRK